MLADADAMATIAVRDLKTATRFYEETLGLKPDGEKHEGGARYRSGKGLTFTCSARAGCSRRDP